MSHFSTVYNRDFVKHNNDPKPIKLWSKRDNVDSIKCLSESYLTCDKSAKPPYDNADDFLLRLKKNHANVCKELFNKPLNSAKIHEYLKMESQYKRDFCKGNNKPKSINIVPRNYNYISGQSTTYLMEYQIPDFYGSSNVVTINPNRKRMDSMGELIRVGHLYQANVKLSEYQSQYNQRKRLYFNEIDK